MRAVMALSGGMDSTGLLMRLLADGYEVSCLSFDYGQKHAIELERAKENISYLSQNGIHVDHRIAELGSVMGLFHSALTTEGFDVPEGHYESEQMKQTVVPNRNAIFASILYGYALSVALREGEETKIALGVHSGDHEIYPDCRPEFYEAIGEGWSLSNVVSTAEATDLSRHDSPVQLQVRDLPVIGVKGVACRACDSTNTIASSSMRRAASRDHSQHYQCNDCNHKWIER